MGCAWFLSNRGPNDFNYSLLMSQWEAVATKCCWVSLSQTFWSMLCVPQPRASASHLPLTWFSFLLLETHNIQELGYFVKHSFVFWSLQKHTKFLKRKVLELHSALLYQIRDICISPKDTGSPASEWSSVSSTEGHSLPKLQFTPVLWTFHCSLPFLFSSHSSF